MAGFFDFLLDNDRYDKPGIARLNLRYNFIVAPFRNDVEGAAVLDLASHDGRWPFALSSAGAKRVVGIEGRGESIARFDRFPDCAAKRRVELRQADIFDALREMQQTGERFEVISILGVYYHITDHYGLLKLTKALSPKLVIIDSEFLTLKWPCVGLVFERTDNDHNAIAQFNGEELAAVGTPSKIALDKMAENLGYRLEWLDWESVPSPDRSVVEDYYRNGDKRRFTCALRPCL